MCALHASAFLCQSELIRNGTSENTLKISICNPVYIQRLLESVHQFGVHVNVAVFWIPAPCSLVEKDRRFRSVCGLHHQGDRLILYSTSSPQTQTSPYPTVDTITVCLHF
jgi:hypothetical protein